MLCGRRRYTMLPSTKRNLVLGVFLVIVTLVVLYSYCNGNSVCYTFPFFSGLERDRLVKPEVVVTSVIVQTKRPFDMGRFSGKSKGKHDEQDRLKQTEQFIEYYQKNDEKTTKNFTGEVEKLHFDRNKTFHLQGENEDNRTQDAAEPKKQLLPPSDIVGKVAEEILRRENVSEEEANRELFRVEKVDEIVENAQRKQENALLRKVKESRRAGEKKAEKKLVRVERVDLTDEEEEENTIQSQKELRKSQSRDFAVNNAANRSSRIEFNKEAKYENLELAHARRFGITNPKSSILNANSTLVTETDKSRNFTKNNTIVDELSSTIPPFFANFLNITSKEREMIDILHNFTNESKPLEPLDGPEKNFFHQEKVTEEKKPGMSSSNKTPPAHVQKNDTPEKRNLAGASQLDSLVAKLLNITRHRQFTPQAHNTPKTFNESLNLTAVLAKITKKGLETKYTDTQVPDSTALLVKFLKEGSRYRLRMPHNVIAGHLDNESSQIEKLESDNNESQSSTKDSSFDLKSEITKEKENEADLGMLKLLLHQSTLQDLGTFNLSNVLKEIASNSLKNIVTALQPAKVRRYEEEDELGTSGAQSDVEIFRPTADEQESSATELWSFNSDKEVSSTHASLNTTPSLTNQNSSLGSGVGTGDLEDEKSHIRKRNDRRLVR